MFLRFWLNQQVNIGVLREIFAILLTPQQPVSDFCLKALTPCRRIRKSVTFCGQRNSPFVHFPAPKAAPRWLRCENRRNGKELLPFGPKSQHSGTISAESLPFGPKSQRVAPPPCHSARFRNGKPGSPDARDCTHRRARTGSLTTTCRKLATENLIHN